MSRSGRRPCVAVVGAGAAGVLTAAAIAREAGRRGQGVDVLLVDPSAETGRGVAYSTENDTHLLNVPAGRLSARADRPGDFVRWLRERVDPGAGEATFARRRDYGSYLTNVLADSLVASRGQAHLERVFERATGAHPVGRRVRLRTGALGVRWVDAVVLATGPMPPSTSWAPEGLRRSSRFVADPWQPGALARVPGDQDVMLVGTGLTMVDVAAALDREGRVVTAVSRQGLLPRAHRAPGASGPGTRGGTPTPLGLPDGPVRAAQLDEAVAREVGDHLRAHGDWRPAVDGLRACTSSLWQRMDDLERAAFLDGPARRWGVLRHRMAPAAAASFGAARLAGRLRVRAGEVGDAVEDHHGLQVTLTDGSVHHVGAVVACTGAQASVRGSSDPLMLGLLESGAARPGSQGLGVACAADGRVLASDGSPHAWLWALGSLRVGDLWESTAMPEIRAQAHVVADRIWDSLPGPATAPARPRDPYGLPLTANAASAAAYVEGLEAILRVSGGAEAAMRRSVELDPAFAVGHATLALLGHEWGADVDVSDAIDRATEAVRFRGDERERSLVGAVVARIRTGGPAADVALLRHIGAYPEDALAVSVAVPTIAFAGATEVPQEAWTLIEGLGPVYRGDWWYAGLLAFMRQEQQRWAEAAQLARTALAQEPGAGHAAHALTHVYYETGDHERGLEWLDPWIAARGEVSSHAAHFSWHAALHELALERDVAVAARYETSLRPPAVLGVRALVDSGSLLWRCGLRGREDMPARAAEVLDSVPGGLVAAPPTAFLAMHVVIALAAAQDAPRLHLLATHAASHPSGTFREVVSPLAAALLALVSGSPHVAADLLTTLQGRLGSLGGSAAQREVVEDTLLGALVQARRFSEAELLLRRRLDRRPSPADRSAMLRARSATTTSALRRP